MISHLLSDLNTHVDNDIPDSRYLAPAPPPPPSLTPQRVSASTKTVLQTVENLPHPPTLQRNMAPRPAACRHGQREPRPAFGESVPHPQKEVRVVEVSTPDKAKVLPGNQKAKAATGINVTPDSRNPLLFYFSVGGKITTNYVINYRYLQSLAPDIHTLYNDIVTVADIFVQSANRQLHSLSVDKFRASFNIKSGLSLNDIQAHSLRHHILSLSDTSKHFLTHKEKIALFIDNFKFGSETIDCATAFYLRSLDQIYFSDDFYNYDHLTMIFIYLHELSHASNAKDNYYFNLVNALPLREEVYKKSTYTTEKLIKKWLSIAKNQIINHKAQSARLDLIPGEDYFNMYSGKAPLAHFQMKNVIEELSVHNADTIIFTLFAFADINEISLALREKGFNKVNGYKHKIKHAALLDAYNNHLNAAS